MKLFEFQPKLFSCLKGYNKATFMSDLMAGIIVGIVALPLAIAFGIASGVTPEKGIITAEQALGQLRYKSVNHQICILSQQVIDRYLEFVECLIIQTEEDM